MSATPVHHPLYGMLPTDLEGFDALAELALDMHSSWNHATDHVWRRLDPVLWALTHNPWGILQTVSREKLQKELAEPVFRKQLDELVQARREDTEAPAWFQQSLPAIAPELCGLFQHGVHAERGPAHLLGRTRQRGRGSTQVRQ